MVYPAAWVRIPLAPPYGTLAQWSVPPAHNRSYAGSNPARSTKRAAASGELAPSVTSGSKKAQSGKPDTHHPAGKTVLQHRTPVISERLSKSAGFCDRQSLQLRWDDFFSLVSRPSRRFIFPAKSLVPTGTAFTACPAYRFPVIPGRLNFLKGCQPTSSRCAARTCRLSGFYFLIFIQEVFSLALYSVAACLSFY